MSGPKPKFKKMDVPVPVHDWLEELKIELRPQFGYTPTFPEVWRHVIEQYKATDQLIRDVKSSR